MGIINHNKQIQLVNHCSIQCLVSENNTCSISGIFSLNEIFRNSYIKHISYAQANDNLALNTTV